MNTVADILRPETNASHPCIIVSKTVKHIEINFTKKVKHLCIENYMTLMEEDTNK